MEKKYWVGFNLIRGIGAVRLQALINYFGDLSLAWQAPLDGLQTAGLSNKLAERIIQTRKDLNLDRLVEHALTQGVNILTWEDEMYPSLLKEIEQPPPVLYTRGTLDKKDLCAVAVVGTRRVSGYGRQVTEELVSYLASKGVTIVSGLARGIDSIAHMSALKAGGRTLAVLGSGVDRIYPPEHRQLAEKVITDGALLSDYPLGTMPDSSNFPPRNRIISGLALATVVVEAGETSGALITAQFAIDQGREVYAVPGNIFAPQSKGTNKLIAQGAHPLISARDITDLFDMTEISEKQEFRRVIPTDEVEIQLLQVLSHEPKHVDEIRDQTGLAIERITASLTMLELKGLVKQIGGMNIISIQEGYTGYLSGKPSGKNGR